MKQVKRKGLGKNFATSPQKSTLNKVKIILPPDERVAKKSDFGGFTPLDESGRGEGDHKVYVTKFTIQGHEGDGKFNGQEFLKEADFFKALEYIYCYEVKYLLDNGEDVYDGKPHGYCKTWVSVLWEDGLIGEVRVDMSYREFSPYKLQCFEDYFSDEDKPTDEHVFSQKGFENKNYLKEPKFDINQDIKTKREAEETRLDGDKFRGSRYDGNLSNQEIGKRVKSEILASYPNMKVSVKTAGYSSIDVTIDDFGFNPFEQTFIDHLANGGNFGNYIDVYGDRSQKYYNKKALEIKEVCQEFLNTYKRSNSDSQTDYFDSNFSGYVDVNTTNLVKLYASDSTEAKRDLAYKVEQQIRDEKRRLAKAEIMKKIIYRYGDVVMAEFWVKRVKEWLPAEVLKAPNGEGGLDYFIYSLTPATEEEAKIGYEKDKIDYAEAKGNRKPRIRIFYLDGKPYKSGLYKNESIHVSYLKPYDGTFSTYYKEQQALKNAPKVEKFKKVEPVDKVVERKTISTPVQPSNNTTTFEITHNTKQNGTEIRFNSKPSEEVLTHLKSMGFRWGKFNKTWYIKGYSEKIVKELTDYLTPDGEKKVGLEVQAEWLYGQFQILADDALRTKF